MHFESTASARAMLDEAHKQGVPQARVLREAGLDSSVIDPPALHVPWPAMSALIRTAAHLTKDAAFGLHAGADMDFRHIDMAGPYALNQPAIRDGIRITWGEVQPLMTNVICSQVHEKGSTATLRLDCSVEDSDELAHLIEFYLMAHVNCCRLVDRPEWVPQRARFRHNAPADIREQRRLFGVTPECGAPVNELIFDRAFLDIRFPLADPTLLKALQPRYEAYLDALQHGRAVTLWLRNSLHQALDEHGRLELGPIAKGMRMRPRTLQHKLAAEGTTFHQVRDAVRRDVAMRDLKSSNTGLDAVAARLKYSDSRAFLRAFRRWTGETPGQWKERQRVAE